MPKKETPQPKKFPEQEVRSILEKVYTAGWKQNKKNPTGFTNQMSIEQALEAIKNL